MNHVITSGAHLGALRGGSGTHGQPLHHEHRGVLVAVAEIQLLMGGDLPSNTGGVLKWIVGGLLM